jgi:hypothetical protein
MASYQYAPINNSCLNVENTSKVYGTLSLDDSLKKKYKKTLSMMSKGSTFDSDNNIYTDTSYCVVPKETSDFFNASYSQFDRTNNDINAVFPNGYYVDNSDNNKFANSLTEFTNIIEKNNNDDLITLSNTISANKIRNSNYEYITLSNALIDNYNTSNTYLQTNAKCIASNASFADTSNYIYKTINSNINGNLTILNNKVTNYNNTLTSVNNKLQSCVKNTPFIMRSGLNNDKCFEILGLSNANSINWGNGQGLKTAVNPCYKTINQRFYLDDQSRLRTVYDSNICLDVAYAARGNGSRIHYWDCADYPNRKWTYNSNAKTFSPIYAPNMCLDVPNVDKNTNAYIWQCHGGPQQRWDLESTKTFTPINSSLMQNYNSSLPTFFQFRNYGGSFVSLTRGDYTLALLREIASNFKWTADINDALQSIYIPDGYKITVYEHDIFQGRSLQLSSSISDLNTYGFLNAISSIIIR